ncbi:MAG: DUF1499 domain-containing protein [Acidobacteriota bacterium]
MKALLFAAAALGAIAVAGLAVLALWSQRSPRLGLRDGKLRPCRRATNCVSTAAGDAPPLPFVGSAEASLDRLTGVLADLPRCRVTDRQGLYLRAVCRSRLFRFADDVEALADPEAGIVHLRSASRVGLGDHGVNRARLTEIRRRYTGPR